MRFLWRFASFSLVFGAARCFRRGFLAEYAKCRRHRVCIGTMRRLIRVKLRAADREIRLISRMQSARRNSSLYRQVIFELINIHRKANLFTNMNPICRSVALRLIRIIPESDWRNFDADTQNFDVRFCFPDCDDCCLGRSDKAPRSLIVTYGWWKRTKKEYPKETDMPQQSVRPNCALKCFNYGKIWRIIIVFGDFKGVFRI